MQHIKNNILLIALSTIIFCSASCGKNYDNAAAAVTAAIIAIEQHDMQKLWNMLGPEAQSFYNSLGEKQRRSGRGALEREVNIIKTFRSLRNDYKIREDKENREIINITWNAGQQFRVVMIKDGDAYKIKDGESVKNMLSAIAYEKNAKEDY